MAYLNRPHPIVLMVQQTRPPRVAPIGIAHKTHIQAHGSLFQQSFCTIPAILANAHCDLAGQDCIHPHPKVQVNGRHKKARISRLLWHPSWPEAFCCPKTDCLQARADAKETCCSPPNPACMSPAGINFNKITAPYRLVTTALYHTRGHCKRLHLAAPFIDTLEAAPITLARYRALLRTDCLTPYHFKRHFCWSTQQSLQALTLGS